MFVSYISSTMCVTSGAGAKFVSGFLWDSCCSILVFCGVFYRPLFVFFLLAIILSILLRFTAFDYLFGIFKLFLTDVDRP
jgi:hypothetical protein